MNKSHLTEEERMTIDQNLCGDVEIWGGFVSEICQICLEYADDKYHNALERYWLRGNICSRCNARAEHNVRFHLNKDDDGARNLLEAIFTHQPLPESHVAIEYM